MRLVIASLASLLLSAGPALASSCATQQDLAALKVASLKSELMVTAITCHDQARYNAFMNKFHPDLAGNDKNLLAYFTRAYGRGGLKQHDDYITSLANAQSNAGLAQGTNLCLGNEPMFDEVMALPSGDDLPDYAAGKNLAQPLVAVACADVPAALPKTRLAKARTSGHAASHGGTRTAKSTTTAHKKST